MTSKNTRVVFSDVGFPVPVEQRPLWRLTIICCCISVLGNPNTGLNLNKVRVACWMLIRKHLWKEYQEFMLFERGNKPRFAIDSATDKAIELGLEKGYFDINNGRLILSEVGISLLIIVEANSLFLEEKEFLGGSAVSPWA